MTSSSFESSKVLPPPPCESTPLGGVSLGGPVSQDKKKKSSRSVFQVVMLLLVCLGFTVFSRRSSLASSSSVVDQSILKSENKVEYENDRSNDVSPTASLTEVINTNENDKIVFPNASLVELETKSSPRAITQAILEFPPGLYDENMDITKKENIQRACNNYLRDNVGIITEHILACHMYQSVDFPIVLGTFKTGADMLELAYDMEEIDESDVTSLFDEFALASMIDRGCLQWNRQGTGTDNIFTEYNGRSSYMRRSRTATGLDVGTSATYFGVTATAGYSRMNTVSGGTEVTTASAYGHRTYVSRVGVLDNLCFSQRRFNRDIRDLVKPEWVRCWTALRENGQRATIKQILDTSNDCFSKIAEGGFFMPLRYNYEVGTKITLSTKYSSSSTDDKTKASTVVTAGISATTGNFSGTVSSAIRNAVETSSRSTGYSSSVRQVANSYGHEVSIDCLQQGGSCDREITDSVAATRANYTLLGPPSSLGTSYISLDDILKLYFGTSNYGLPDNFVAAYSCTLPPERTKCTHDYGSNVACCNQGGRVYPEHQCPQSRPTCINFIDGNRWGTCVMASSTAPTKRCGSHFGTGQPCCGQQHHGAGWVHHRNQCERSAPVCVNFQHNRLFGDCIDTCPPTGQF